MFESKHKVRLLLLLAAATFLSTHLIGYAFIIHQEHNKRSGKSQKEFNGKSSERFLNETAQGRVVLTYLRCTDFDCVEALRSIVKFGPDIVPPLINLLERPVPRMIAPDIPKDQLEPLVRIRVINALSKLQDKRSVGALLKAVSERSVQIRAAAAEALGNIDDVRALPALILLLQDDDQLVRETSAKSLGKLKRPGALAPLREAVKKESAPHVRKAMEQSIRSIEQR